MKFFRRTRPISDSASWRRVLYFSVGGLTEVGFSSDEATLLVISHAGRGLFDLTTGARLARDDEMPSLECSWIDKSRMLVQGIGSAQDQWFSSVGLWGGTLSPSSHDQWSVQLKSSGHNEFAYAINTKSGDKWLVDKPITEVKAFGFSATGRFLLLATSSDVTAYAHAA